MRLNKQAFSTALLLSTSVGLLALPNIGKASENPLPQPNTTIKIDGSLSTAASNPVFGVTPKTTNTQTDTTSTKSMTPATLTPAQKVIAINHPKIVAVEKVQVVELKSEFVSKEQALKIAKKEHYPFNIAYSITAGKTIKPEAISDNRYFYVNRKTHRIGVAINRIAARFISVAKHHVYSVRGGDTLKTTLMRWAMEGGYQIEWLSEYDYPLKYSYDFTGKLSDKIGPLNKILSSISGSSYALKAVITKNNVILIKDNDYSPSILGR